MAKGQKRRNREVKKAAAGVVAARHQLSDRLVPQRAATSDRRRRPIPEKDCKMKFRPLHDRVVLRRLTPEEKTAGGIIVPETAKEKPVEGEVIAVGPGVPDRQGVIVKLEVKDGDHVLFGKWSGTEVKIDGEELLIIKESDLLGIIANRTIKARAA